MTNSAPLRAKLSVCIGIAGIFAGVLTGGSVHGQDAGSGRQSVLAYAEWARQVAEAPPEGIRLLPVLEDRLAERTGHERCERDLPALERDADLQRAARAHAIDMLERDYVGHTDPDGRSAADRVAILDRRFIGATGENLAEYTGLPQQAAPEQIGPLALKLTGGFLDSPEHRENLLSPDYNRQGIGAAGRGERLIVVHVFGDRLAALQRDLPLQVSEGDALPLAFEEGSGLSVPPTYGFARPGQPSGEIVPLDVATREVPVGPGTYQLMFFLPEAADRFLVAPGPILVVR